MDIGILVFQTGYSMDPAVLAKRAEELGFESFLYRIFRSCPSKPRVAMVTTPMAPLTAGCWALQAMSRKTKSWVLALSRTRL